MLNEGDFRSKEGYTYDNLKEFKQKLEDRQGELAKREKEIEEARIMVTRSTLDLERRELEVETFKVEKELLAKERSIAEEENMRLRQLCEDLQIENKQLNFQVSEEKNIREHHANYIDSLALQESRRELEKVKMLCEQMKFKFNDYDRLMHEVM